MQTVFKRFISFLLSVCLCAATMFGSATARVEKFDGDFRFAAGGPNLIGTLADSFADPNGDGKAARGAEVTYTATLVNTGATAAANVNLSVSLDPNATLVANSTSVARRPLPAVVSTNPANGATGVSQSATISVDFNQPVNASASSFSLECPAGSARAFSVGGSGTSTITLTPTANLPASTTCQARVIASQITSVGGGDRLTADYVFAFTTAAAAAVLRISEVAPNITSNRDLVELVVIQSGRTDGITFLQDSTVLATLPDVQVAAGDVIVLHLNPLAGSGDAPASETTGKSQYPTAVYSANYDAAWDFLGGVVAITYSSRILKIKDANGVTQDGVSFNRLSGTPPGGFPAQLQTLQAEGQWLPSDCGGALCTTTSTPTAGQVSANWDNVGTTRAGNTVRRVSATDTNTANDWGVGPPTLGAANSLAGFEANRTKLSAGAVETELAETGGLGAPVSVGLGAIQPNEVVVVTFRVTVNEATPAGTTGIAAQGAVTGDNFGPFVTDDPATPAADDATVTPLEPAAPTAARLSVAGRVLTPEGRAVSNARVALVDPNGVTLTVRTNQFGFYRFDDLAAGQTIVVSATAKRFRFAAQIVNLTESLTELNFFGEL